jgi:hypothetical protein
MMGERMVYVRVKPAGSLLSTSGKAKSLQRTMIWNFREIIVAESDM